MEINNETLERVKSEFGDVKVRVTWGSNRKYLRFGYWKQVSEETLNEILGPSIIAVEFDDYDEDCGWLYSYDLYSKEEWDKKEAEKTASWCHYSGMPNPSAYENIK